MVIGYITVGVVLGLVMGFALNELVRKLGWRSQESRLRQYENEIEDLETELLRLRQEVRHGNRNRIGLKVRTKKEVET